eukprot:3283848-Rhodomonas_salina.1
MIQPELEALEIETTMNSQRKLNFEAPQYPEAFGSLNNFVECEGGDFVLQSVPKKIPRRRRDQQMLDEALQAEKQKQGAVEVVQRAVRCLHARRAVEQMREQHEQQKHPATEMKDHATKTEKQWLAAEVVQRTVRCFRARRA